MEIGFEGLRIPCVVGVLDHERQREQVIEADLMVQIDVQEAVMTDDISLTIGYDILADLLINHSREGKFLLLETLVTEFRNVLGEKYPQISGGSITVRKPGALPLAAAAVVRLRW